MIMRCSEPCTQYVSIQVHVFIQVLKYDIYNECTSAFIFENLMSITA